MPDALLMALGLVLIIEGVLPFIAPAVWRASLQRMARLRDGQVRFVALGAILIGLLLIVL
ncbi:MAG TPA: DUF2065 domain-containing protein [Burkholderiaceae bacterium]|nr:DUF2065 domain-containing protein [Burkholderiaceae bacterium]